MGNTIRLGIATIGLAFNRYIMHTKMKKEKPVLLVLGRQESGKTTVVSRIRNGKDELCVTNYVKTNGFSVQEVKEKDTNVKLYDIGGSENMRELWSHYYGDAHGFIYVIDSSSSSNEIQDSAKILEQILKDERVQGKPILILGNKQDMDNALTEMEITNQMDLIRLVNTAKCLTRLDVCTAIQPTKHDSGINIGFRWLVSHIKWRWSELNDRVEHDAMIEKRTENAKFELMKEQIHTNKNHTTTIKNHHHTTRTKNHTTTINIEMNDDHDHHHNLKQNLNKCDSISLKRLDPEGGNEIITSIGDISSNFTNSRVNKGQDVQTILVKAQAQVHEFMTTPLPPSESNPQEIIPPLNPPKRKLSNGTVSPKKIKFFRNKTAPMDLRTENQISYFTETTN